jgi:hypothetical protein
MHCGFGPRLEGWAVAQGIGLCRGRICTALKSLPKGLPKHAPNAEFSSCCHLTPPALQATWCAGARMATSSISAALTGRSRLMACVWSSGRWSRC